MANNDNPQKPRLHIQEAEPRTETYLQIVLFSRQTSWQCDKKDTVVQLDKYLQTAIL